MLYVCGLRVSEALSLKVDDIDFSLNCLSVRKAKSDIVTEDIGISTHDPRRKNDRCASAWQFRWILKYPAYIPETPPAFPYHAKTPQARPYAA